MTSLSEYQSRTQQFILYAPRLELHYVIPGLRCEIDEWIDTPEKTADELSEMGDCLFMLARIFAHFGVAIDDSTPALPGTLHDIRRASSKMLNVWLKVVYQRDGVVDESKRALILDHAVNALCYLHTLTRARGMTLGELAESNIAKLTERYSGVNAA